MSEALLQVLSRGTIVAVLSTVDPRTVPQLAELANPFGVHVVDATVCRGGRAADEGTLLSFVGGDADVVERLAPVLACYCTDIVHTGGVGTAQVAKAASNMLMWACLIANHEALALAKRFGMDVDLLRASLLKTGADNHVLRHWGTNTMAWAEDDLEIVQRLCAEADLELLAVMPYDEAVRMADREGLAPIDHDPSSPMVRAVGELATRLEADWQFPA